ncbi:universal stress protein [Streptacidiphilus pinicola]|uniref:Universal stress protein n=1 Tax=Streptacidiphilus pinicola TaxID=2219663 RepID=A0A2X0IDU3_9ACTN|nr:universal stress protein [Streptacidiphilus pinicola]RAG81591.1 universal stress protein [Streptacidiphilus pinicola]
MKDTQRTELSPLVRPSRVVVGVTGSASSAAAVRLAAAEARRSGRALVAVLAWEPPGGEAGYRAAPDPELVRIWERAAMERLDAALVSAFSEPGDGSTPPQGPCIERLVVRGPAALALTWLADRPDDLLVLGAGTRHRLARLLRGRVRRQALARTHTPVMLVAPPAQPPALPRSVRRELRRITPEDFLRPSGLGTAR